MPNGVAYADGSLKIGDILLKIDGENVANGKHKKVVKLLQKATKKVKLVVKRTELTLKNSLMIYIHLQHVPYSYIPPLFSLRIFCKKGQ